MSSGELANYTAIRRRDKAFVTTFSTVGHMEERVHLRSSKEEFYSATLVRVERCRR